jgi:hypothetical protein
MLLLLGMIGLMCVCCSRNESRSLRNEQAFERPVIKVLPGLKAQVNAETGGNSIPWGRSEEKSDVTLSAQLSAEVEMASTVRGEWQYTFHKYTFLVVNVEEGGWGTVPLVFFVETTFPVPGSDIRVKGMRLFRRDEILTFKLRKGAERYLIIAIDPVARLVTGSRAGGSGQEQP